jgi:diguanylate cyclase (GGDEF)-like protein
MSQLIGKRDTAKQGTSSAAWWLRLLVFVRLVQAPVRAATPAEMEARLPDLVGTRLTKLTLPPDVKAAFRERTGKANREMMAAYCNIVGWVNLPATTLDFGILPRHAILADVDFRVVITGMFLLAGQLFKQRRMAGLEHIPLTIICTVTILLAGMNGLNSGSNEAFLNYLIMGIVISCTGIMFLPVDLTGLTWLAGGAITVMTIMVIISSLSTWVEKFEILVFYGAVIIALVKARHTQNLYQQRLFLLRVQDELRTAEANRRNEQLSSMAYVDRLTDVPNRRYFEEISETINAAPENALPLALCMIDIDHFKNLNDKLGHTQGDRCLRVVATAIRNQLRQKSDMVARYGGEEFVLVLPNTGAEQAREIIERVRLAVLALNHPNPGTALEHVSISAGMAVAEHLVSVEILLQEADEALYRAKSGGRNRVSG